MELTVTQKPWAISDRQLKKFSPKNIEHTLNSFNRICSGEYYMVDSFLKRMIVGSSDALFLCGYPKELLEKEGYDFYDRILREDEHAWIKQMNDAGFELFYANPHFKREKILVTYDLAVVTKDGEELILTHKLVPYEFCKNDNLWLRLCHIMVSSSKEKNHDCTFFINTETGQRWVFTDGKYVSTDTPNITLEEIHILRMMVKGLPDKQMCLAFDGLTLNTFKSKKQRLFEKLDVETSASAIHKAHLLGVI